MLSMMFSPPSTIIITDMMIGFAVIAIGVYGLFLTDLKDTTTSSKANQFNTNILLGLVFWSLNSLPFSRETSLWSTLIAILALLTAFLSNVIIKRYGTKGYIIPRFLFGFNISALILSSLVKHWNPNPTLSTFIGLIFTPVTFLTPNLILALLSIFLYSYILASGLNLIFRFFIEYNINNFIWALGISIIAGIIHLYFYYSRIDNNQPTTSSKTKSQGESKPIANSKSLNYKAISNNDEENVLS